MVVFPSATTTRPGRSDDSHAGARRLSAGQWLDARASLIETTAVCVVVSLVSVLFTGSVFGTDNHVFHLPIIHRLYDEAQFKDDAFIQSLRYYSSGIWLLLAGTARYVGDGHLMFFVLFYLSRLLSFIGFVACASLVGICSVRERLIFCIVLCFVQILDGASFAGHGSLFVSSFGHSEVANGTILLAIYFAARVQVAASVALAGLTFFINAFMGMWLMPPLACMIAFLAWRGRISTRRLLTQLAVGGVVFGLLATPILLNIVSNPDFGKAGGFDYPEFLRGYYGVHFFADSNRTSELFLLPSVAIIGWLALSRLKQGEAEFKAVLAGMVGLYVVGVMIPVLTSSPTILNLHLLRSGLMIHLLAAISATALATKWLTSEDGCESATLGPYLSFFLCVNYLFPASVILFAFESSIRNRHEGIHDTRFRTTIFLALCLAVLPWRTLQHFRETSEARAAVGEWETIGKWANGATPLQSMFLIALPNPDAGMTAIQTRRLEALTVGSAVFETASRRRIWVDFKRGAAVMWRPSYYALWKPRIDAVLQLRSLGETLEFADANHIDHVIGDCQAFEAGHMDIAYRTENLCVSKGTAPLS